MSFTTLKVTDKGVLLFALHEERFHNAGKEAIMAYHRFAAEAAPGIYNLYWDNKKMHIKTRGESRLFDGMPVRFIISPLAHTHHRIEKPPSPSIYSGLIEPGIATLLTSAEGKEIYESCSAAVIAWDGKNILKVPRDRPGVKSTMLELLNVLPHIKEQPILRASDYPIALINAVKCTCIVSMEGRKPFPDDQLERIRALYLASARRA
jgi:hypothetical protein